MNNLYMKTAFKSESIYYYIHRFRYQYAAQYAVSH